MTRENVLPRAPGRGAAREVYADILRFGPRPRTELAARLNLSGATLTRLTRTLLDDGLLRELPPVPQLKGRPQEPLDIDEDHARFIGVKITADEVHAAITNPRAVVLEKLTVPLRSSEPAAVLRRVEELAGALARAHPRVAGVGVSLGASVLDRRTLLACPILGWEQPVPIADELERALGLPVAVENDLISLLQGVLWFGIGRRWSSFVLMTIGAGVGVGVVVDGRVVEGRAHLAGQTGSLTTERRDGTAVPLARVAGTPAVLAAARESGAIGARDGLADLLAAVGAGEPAALEVAADVAHGLAVAAAGLVGVLDVEAVLVGGESAALLGGPGGMFDEALRERLAPEQRDVTVRRLLEDFDEWARGAAVIAVQEYLGGL